MPGSPPPRRLSRKRLHGLVARQGNNNNKNNNNYRVRPVSVEQPNAYDISLTSVLEAYEDCIRHKRSSNSYTEFVMSHETALIDLWKSIRAGCYQPSTSITFVVHYPIPREVFAAAFIDRVVHHWIAQRITPILEMFFHSCGNVTMNCRPGYGTLRAIKTVENNIRRFSENYTRDCWIFKGDISNFFMSLDKVLMMEMVAHLINEHYHGDDKRTLLYLLGVTISHCPQDNCERHTPIESWGLVPKRKSLFGSDRSKGMPIGNLPSQLLANLYIAVFANWLVNVKEIDTLVIYADDFTFLMRDKAEICKLIPEIRRFLDEQLLVKLHPDKIYIQHYKHGTKFVGAVIKPGRNYVSSRTIGRFWEKCVEYNKANRTHEEKLASLERYVATINSYLGIMSQHRSYKQRRRICEALILPHWREYLYFTNEFRVCRIKNRYNRTLQAKQDIRKHRRVFDDEAGE